MVAIVYMYIEHKKSKLVMWKHFIHLKSDLDNIINVKCYTFYEKHTKIRKIPWVHEHDDIILKCENKNEEKIK